MLNFKGFYLAPIVVEILFKFFLKLKRLRHIAGNSFKNLLKFINKFKKKALLKNSNAFMMFKQTLFFMSWFTRNCQFMSSFSSSTSKHFSSISRSHSVHKTVLISSFSFRWLKRPFAHCLLSFKLELKYVLGFGKLSCSKTECKYTKTFFSSK